MARKLKVRDDIPAGTPSTAALERRLARASANMRIVERDAEVDADLAQEAAAVSLPDSAPDPDETEFTVPLPEEDNPADVEHAYSNSLEHRPATDEDIDRLWDWIRQEEDRGAVFLGEPVTTSRALYDRLSLFGESLQAMVDAGEHIGILAIEPSGAGPNVMAIHMFIRKESRNQLRRLIPQLQALAVIAYPGVSFAVATQDPALARLYQPFGFKTTHILVWTPPVASDSV